SLNESGDTLRLMRKATSVFDELGIDVLRGNPDEIGKRIAASRLRYVLLATIDHWAALSQYASLSPSAPPTELELRRQLLAIGRRAEHEPWRDAFFRDPKVLDDPTALARQVKTAPPDAMPPRVIITIGMAIWKAGNIEGTEFLTSASAHHNHDFWLHLFLSAISADPTEKIGYAQTSVAIRPFSGGAAAYLGFAYYYNRQPD